jgi:hypothetical protein
MLLPPSMCPLTPIVFQILFFDGAQGMAAAVYPRAGGYR